MIKNNESERKDTNVLGLMYKVLKDRLRLGVDVDNREDIINQFKESAKKIDNQLQLAYQNGLESMFETTTTLEAEKERLERLIKHINSRVESRHELDRDFREVTGRDLVGLDSIDYASSLSEYQNRLKYINEYLTNSEKIKTTEEDIDLLKEELSKEQKTKTINEAKNIKLDEEIKNSFFDAISEVEVIKDNKDINVVDYLKDLTLSSDINDELEELNKKITDIRQDYNTYSLSLNTLRKAGVLENEQDLVNGLTTIGDKLYYHKEQEYILRLFSFISNKGLEYNNIFEKRDAIESILRERKRLRSELSINAVDVFTPFYIVLDSQQVEVDNQKNNINTIDKLTEKIAFKEAKVDSLKKSNEKVEILSLLEEYRLIDTAKIVAPVEEELVDTNQIVEEKESATTLNELASVKPNQIVDTKGIEGISFGEVYAKATKVMNGVADVMNLGLKRKEKETESKYIIKVPTEEPKKIVPKVENKEGFIFPELDLDKEIERPTLIMPSIDAPKVEVKKTETAVSEPSNYIFEPISLEKTEVKEEVKSFWENAPIVNSWDNNTSSEDLKTVKTTRGMEESEAIFPDLSRVTTEIKNNDLNPVDNYVTFPELGNGNNQSLNTSSNVNVTTNDIFFPDLNNVGQENSMIGKQDSNARTLRPTL